MSEYSCPECGNVYDTKNGLCVHYGQSHGGGSPFQVEIECGFCGDKFSVPQSKAERNPRFCSKDCQGKWRSENMKGEKHPSWKGGKPECECIFCGDTYKTWRPEQSRFCSNECRGGWMKENWTGKSNPSSVERVKKECPNCGDKFQTYPSVDNTCCSSRCQAEHYTGKNHPQWEEDFKDYYGSNWEQKRKEALDRDNYTCQDCGEEFEKSQRLSGKLHVHHIKPLKEFDTENIEDEANSLSNLISLCSSCHPKWEMSEKKIVS